MAKKIREVDYTLPKSKGKAKNAMPVPSAPAEMQTTDNTSSDASKGNDKK